LIPGSHEVFIGPILAGIDNILLEVLARAIIPIPFHLSKQFRRSHGSLLSRAPNAELVAAVLRLDRAAVGRAREPGSAAPRTAVRHFKLAAGGPGWIALRAG